MKSATMLVTAATLIGCGQINSSQETENKLAALEEQYATATEASTRLEMMLQNLEGRVGSLELQRDMDKWGEMFETVAVLKPGDAGYSVLRHSLGHVTVSLENVTAYANGTQVTLRFGNPLATSLSGVKFTVEYGTAPEGVPDNAAMKSKDIALTQVLLGGVWNDTDVVLEGLPPADFGFVRIKDFDATEIRLTER